jgi:hypothetical protein
VWLAGRRNQINIQRRTKLDFPITFGDSAGVAVSLVKKFIRRLAQLLKTASRSFYLIPHCEARRLRARPRIGPGSTFLI